MKTIQAMLTVAAFVLVGTHPINAQANSASTPEAPTTSAPDYAKPKSWACIPGNESLCTTNLDMLVYAPNGDKHIEHFKPAENPPIDCFYVYPTVSEELTPYADMKETPHVQRVVHTQAARLSSVCRVFAPIYRQATLHHLSQRLAGQKIVTDAAPKQDIQAAWDYYLSHYNQGRGVVLVGHSQGTGMLQNILVNDIDGKPTQSLLIAAFLAGDSSVGVPPGAKVGGTYKHIPVCSSAAEVGCIFPWGTFADADPVITQNFGRPRTDGLKSACANPAAPNGGAGFPELIAPNTNAASPTDPPFVEYVDQIRGACKELPAGNGFRVSALPGPHQKEIEAIFQSRQKREGWGLHGLDIEMVQGNMLSVIAAESATWQKTHPSAPSH
jgi:hypothetical protein